MAAGNVVLPVKYVSGDGYEVFFLPADVLVAVRQPQQGLLALGQGYRRGQGGVMNLEQPFSGARPFVVGLIDVEIENNGVVFDRIAAKNFHGILLSGQNGAEGQQQKR